MKFLKLSEKHTPSKGYKLQSVAIIRQQPVFKNGKCVELKKLYATVSMGYYPIGNHHNHAIQVWANPFDIVGTNHRQREKAVTEAKEMALFFKIPYVVAEPNYKQLESLWPQYEAATTKKPELTHTVHETKHSYKLRTPKRSDFAANQAGYKAYKTVELENKRIEQIRNRKPN